MAELIVCVDIGGISTKAAAVDRQGNLHHVDSIATQPDVESFFEKLSALIEVTAFKTNISPSQLGVAVAGFLDGARTHLVYNPNIAWLEGFPLLERLREHFPELRIELEIDSNASTMAEFHLGTGSGKKRFLCLTCGTGLGVGMAVEGEPMRFAYGCMGDVGHTIVQHDGPRCSCGGRGCAEVLISANTLAARYGELKGMQREVSLREVIEAAQAGDEAGRAVLERAGEWLGVAAASMANTFFPDHIAVAGGLSAAGDFVLKPAERVFRETASTMAQAGATFGLARLGSSATLIGAGWPFWG